MVRDLDFPLRVQIVPTVREADGLALSSRNVYLSKEQRAAAPSLHAALEKMLDELRNGADAASARESARRAIDPSAQVDYIDVVDADSFEPLASLRAPAFVIGAARFGTTRLIDNIMVAQ
jgi:pantoate--beta-alanine ligase